MGTVVPGQALGHYRIIEPLGAGGMGEVYVAEDTRLNRSVALKVLPPDKAESEERRARFEREARAVAALNHPNIVTVHSVERVGKSHFIAMELVRGESLTRRIPRRGLSLDRFFEIAIPLADAVSAAHAAGVTHRDLKPDNVMIATDGCVKVLDFGLAKLAQTSTTDMRESPTESMTQEGRILGTVNYMSPEQAAGRALDHRTDIFSLGIVFYEMLLGERPFKGDTPTTVLSAIIKDPSPSVMRMDPSIPRGVARVVRRCLAKDPSRRYQTAVDVRNDLEEMKEELDSGVSLDDGGIVARPRRRNRPLVVVLTLAGALLVAAATLLLQPRHRAARRGFSQLTHRAGLELLPTISPDGDFVVYQGLTEGEWDIYRQRVGGERAINLTEGTAVDDTQPAFSPNGDYIAFRSERAGGGIFVMGATGESVRRLTDFGYNPAWSPDGRYLVFATEGVVTEPSSRSPPSQLWTVEVATGETKELFAGDGVQPRWSPHGHRIAYWRGAERPGGPPRRDIMTIGAGGDDPVVVTDDAHMDWNPVWAPDGRHLYFASDRGGTMNLWRIPIEERTGKVKGLPEPVTAPSEWAAHLSVAHEVRRLVYASVTMTQDLEKVAFDPEAEEVAEQSVPITRGAYVSAPDVSPDGRWLVFQSWGKQEDISVIEVDGTDRRQLTDDLPKDRRPRWSPDGARIAFYSERSGKFEPWVINRDGSGLRQLVESPPGISANFPVWSPDGSQLAYYGRHADTTFILDADVPPEKQRPVALPPWTDGDKHFSVWSWSPDGGRLAGVMREAGGSDANGIAIYDFRKSTFKKLTETGLSPVWLNDSRRILFHTRDQVVLLDSETGASKYVLTAPLALFSAVAVSPDNRALYVALKAAESNIWLIDVSS
jgi:Tol biopolymer transport system component